MSALRQPFARAYRAMAGGEDGRLSVTRLVGAPFGLSPRVFLGRGLLLFLFLVIPVFNPEIFQALDERLYVGTVVVILAAALMLPSVFARRYRWILLGLVLGALWVAETTLPHGDFRIGVVGNSYRPLHAVLTFCACAVFLLGANRERWIDLFLIGGLIGCSLAVVHALVPAIDPFALSRPDLPVESLFLETRREEGAFVYPGNLGPYGAYVAIVALVMIERKGLRAVSVNLYTAAFLAGLGAIFVSGSRGAGIGFLVAAAVVFVRSPRLRLPLLAAPVLATAVVAVILWQTGKLDEIVKSRLLLADFSWSLRFGSWDVGWEAFLKNPLLGRGAMPNTIDSTFFYYIGVGGLLGLALVAAMYWVTLLRPVRRGDRGSLPLVLAVLAVGITQEALGTPLTSWAIGAGVFLLAAPEAVYGREHGARDGDEVEGPTGVPPHLREFRRRQAAAPSAPP